MDAMLLVKLKLLTNAIPPQLTLNLCATSSAGTTNMNLQTQNSVMMETPPTETVAQVLVKFNWITFATQQLSAHTLFVLINVVMETISQELVSLKVVMIITWFQAMVAPLLALLSQAMNV